MVFGNICLIARRYTKPKINQLTKARSAIGQYETIFVITKDKDIMEKKVYKSFIIKL